MLGGAAAAAVVSSVVRSWLARLRVLAPDERARALRRQMDLVLRLRNEAGVGHVLLGFAAFALVLRDLDPAAPSFVLLGCPPVGALCIVFGSSRVSRHWTDLVGGAGVDLVGIGILACWLSLGAEPPTLLFARRLAGLPLIALHVVSITCAAAIALAVREAPHPLARPARDGDLIEDARGAVHHSATGALLVAVPLGCAFLGGLALSIGRTEGPAVLIDDLFSALFDLHLGSRHHVAPPMVVAAALLCVSLLALGLSALATLEPERLLPTLRIVDGSLATLLGVVAALLAIEGAIEPAALGLVFWAELQLVLGSIASRLPRA